MPIRLGRILQCLVLAIGLFCGPATAQQTPGAPQSFNQASGDMAAMASVESLRLQLDEVEAAARREGLSDSALAVLRTSVANLREELRDKIGDLEQRLSGVDARLTELGPEPARGTPEIATFTADRARFTAQRTDLDAALKRARALLVRADAITVHVTERRRSLFARELFVRSASALDPSFWQKAFENVPDTVRGVYLLGRSWGNFAVERGGLIALLGAGLTLIGFAVAASVVGRYITRRRIARSAPVTRFAKARAALLALLQNALMAPAGAATVLLVLDGFSLVPPRILEIGIGFVSAVAIASFGRAVAIALFAPQERERRLIPLQDEAALLLARHLTIGARILAVVFFVNVIQRAVVAPIDATVATGAVLALLTGGLLMHLLLRFAKLQGAENDGLRGQWLRSFGWILIAIAIIALATGHISFAAFLAHRLLVVLAVMAALYICLVFTDTLFTEVLTGETRRGRAVAGFLGLKPRSLELFGTLLSAIIRLMLVMVVIFPLLGPWGIFASDFFGVVREAALGFRIGDITISPAAILAALMLILAGVIATRAVQRWLQTRFLPRTSLEPSLQHSVSTIFGYLGVVTALAIALAALGIDLQKITLVAGALSIGIGFGLQSVVSNFVSGLILLTERPIRVGDMIVVKGEEGWVRRIRVRATEIETFERASVIIPNSELITGVVKNWTHANTFGRITIKIGVGYDSDVEAVRDILLAAARNHPQVVQNPPPNAFLVNFGNHALEFELRCVVRNVEDGMAVKSDLSFLILRQFREQGIDIPFPQQVTWQGEDLRQKSEKTPKTRS